MVAIPRSEKLSALIPEPRQVPLVCFYRQVVLGFVLT